MNALSLFTKETLVYSSLLIAGTIFVVKRLFGNKKVDKSFYDKNKKKLTTRAKLFFCNLNKKVEIKQKNSNSNVTGIAKENENKFSKMKKIVDKISNEFVKTYKEKDEDKTSKRRDFSPSKKDQIFYYLLNNISNMMVESKKIDAK